MEAASRKANGVHYTPRELAAFLAGLTFNAIQSAGPIHVLDPACGDGGLLVAFANAVPKAARHRLVLTGYETDSSALDVARANCSAIGAGRVILEEQDFLSLEGVEHRASQRDLFEQRLVVKEQFDAVIANPPYVRTQVLGAKRAQQLAEKFGLTGRVDLYHAFVKAMASVLKPQGVLGLLTSNRFLTVRSGAALRHLLRTEFNINAIYDLGDTRLFAAAVLPVVLIATKERIPDPICTFDRVYERRDNGAEVQTSSFSNSVLEAVLDRTQQGIVETPKGVYCVERGTLSVANDDAWTLSTPQVDAWLDTIIANRECVFADVGKVRVGVKTTADEVFIRPRWDDLPPGMQPEKALLKPLITHVEADRWFADPARSLKRILYPHEMRGQRRAAVDLAGYPRAAAYLKSHEKRLRSRKYVLDSGRQWYEIWVPQHPDQWNKPKIVYPDISEHPRFMLDTSGAIANGDCYWITLHEGQDSDWLPLMLAVANSTFITRYYDAMYHNKLYAGRRRFMTQYVSGFPLPRLKSARGSRIVRLVKALIESGKPDPVVERQIDQLVWQAFGLSQI